MPSQRSEEWYTLPVEQRYYEFEMTPERRARASVGIRRNRLRCEKCGRLFKRTEITEHRIGCKGID